ncbi:hypothetical protein AMATHDRAFT_64527 [Amanita thiersii Skay4041]|uniref:Nudix hydrolase domain-containing protein n=1 Tax=Amanita thiersii Skay4041 TaxID=703135 RepID=A0A2A9NKQ9_9AGAR|nr:hypothetical protein AMATHDRAFT_64527 [Amanita thiersii Skay4041]
MSFFNAFSRNNTVETSEFSSRTIPDCGWAAQDFLLAAGMVIFQLGTDKVVVVNDPTVRSWFLPRGRKDVGESLEQAALREAYEESGYRVQFLPLYTRTWAPSPPSDPDAHCRCNTEPIYMTITSYRARYGRNRLVRTAGEYLTSWYVGCINEDAVRETGTGMPDEQNYVSHLLNIEDAYNRLRGSERSVLLYAWCVYNETKRIVFGEQQTAQAAAAPRRTGSLA